MEDRRILYIGAICSRVLALEFSSINHSQSVSRRLRQRAIAYNVKRILFSRIDLLDPLDTMCIYVYQFSELY